MMVIQGQKLKWQDWCHGCLERDFRKQCKLTGISTKEISEEKSRNCYVKRFRGQKTPHGDKLT